MNEENGGEEWVRTFTELLFCGYCSRLLHCWGNILFFGCLPIALQQAWSLPEAGAPWYYPPSKQLLVIKRLQAMPRQNLFRYSQMRWLWLAPIFLHWACSSFYRVLSSRSIKSFSRKFSRTTGPLPMTTRCTWFASSYLVLSPHCSCLNR